MSKQIWTAESIFPGHPDKLADAVADAIVAEAGKREKRALVGVEVAVHRNNVFITGRVACTGCRRTLIFSGTRPRGVCIGRL